MYSALIPAFLALRIEQLYPIVIPVGIVFIVIGLPVICLTILSLYRIHYRKESRRIEAEQYRILRELHDGLENFEKRIESLETIVLEKHRPSSHERNL